MHHRWAPDEGAGTWWWWWRKGSNCLNDVRKLSSWEPTTFLFVNFGPLAAREQLHVCHQFLMYVAPSAGSSGLLLIWPFWLLTFACRCELHIYTSCSQPARSASRFFRTLESSDFKVHVGVLGDLHKASWSRDPEVCTDPFWRLNFHLDFTQRSCEQRVPSTSIRTWLINKLVRKDKINTWKWISVNTVNNVWVDDFVVLDSSLQFV